MLSTLEKKINFRIFNFFGKAERAQTVGPMPYRWGWRLEKAVSRATLFIVILKVHKYATICTWQHFYVSLFFFFFCNSPLLVPSICTFSCVLIYISVQNLVFRCSSQSSPWWLKGHWSKVHWKTRPLVQTRAYLVYHLGL